MNHEMNTLAIGKQEAFSTVVSNKVPATAHCMSDGIHKAKQQRTTREAGDGAKEGNVIRKKEEDKER